ncbi:MAG: lysophospholipid acyltransferase family protein, partial [Elusimicrobiota bacterium]
EEVDLDLLPALQSLRREGRGVVLATPNFGLVGHALWALRLKGIPLLLPILNRDFLAHHEAGVFSGVSTVGKSARPSLRSLREGGVVAAIVDINYLPHRPATPFFGAPAPLGYAASRLARTSGAPLLPAYAVVREGRCRFESHDPIDPRGRSLEEVNLLLARSMERAIGAHPEQWLVYNDFWDIEAMDLEYRLARKLARWS